VVVPCGVDIFSFDHLNELDCLATLVDLATSPLSGLSGSCNKLADNVPLLIALLESELTPEEICILIGECSSAKKIHPNAHKNAKHSLSAVPDQDCLSCKSVVAVVENQLQSNQTETEIEDAVRMLCACECSMSPKLSSHLLHNPSPLFNCQ
jgi:hypothetical protein